MYAEDNTNFRDDYVFANFVEYAKSRGTDGYQFMSNTDCAYAQFLKDTGRAVHPIVGGTSWRERLTDDWTLIDNRLAYYDHGLDAPRSPLNSNSFDEIVTKLGL